ncbi:hypothetical protein [Deinococcus ruber]|nr:hypothetical protein [Deinococcus ruber]
MQHIIRACDRLTRQAEDVIVLEGPYDQPYQVLSPLWEVRSDVSRLLHELEHGDVLTALEQSGGACLRGLPDSAWVVRRRAELATAVLGALEPLIAGAEAAGAAQDVVRLTSAGLRVLPEQRGLAERRLQAARACESEDGVASFQAELKMLGGA